MFQFTKFYIFIQKKFSSKEIYKSQFLIHYKFSINNVLLINKYLGIHLMLFYIFIKKKFQS